MNVEALSSPPQPIVLRLGPILHKMRKAAPPLLFG